MPAPRARIRDRARNLRPLFLFCLLLACVRPQPVDQPPTPAPAGLPKAAVRPPEPPRERVPQVTLGPPAPLLIRVGLATDLERLELPCCDARLVLLAGDERWPLSEETTVAPADVVAKKPVFRLQVAALKDELQARGIAEYLAGATGRPADVVFDAGSDLYKVRYGRFASRAAADGERDRLAGLGVLQAWVTSEGGELDNPGFALSRGAKKSGVPGRWLEVEAPEDTGIAVHRGTYRGRILLFLNDRGLLNLINEIDVEEYLRGVVPREMGPELYDQIEALKAQSVAARTYAVRNLGEFSNEGYDICSTPRCQVYGGMKAEHRLSDQAIAATAGQVVLYHGEPAETFYGATCGGHTEDVEVVFPLKRGAYLRGVPCMEAGPRRIDGDAAPEIGFPTALTERLLPPPPGAPPRALAARIERLSELAGLPMPDDRLASLERREVVRYLSSVLDLALDPRVLSPDTDVADPPPEWLPRDVRFASYVAESGLLADPSDRRLDAAEAEMLLYRLALFLGVLRRDETHFVELGDAGLAVRTAAGRETWKLPEKLVTVRRQGPALATGPLELEAGDRLEVYRQRGRIVALVQPLEARPVSLARHAPKQRWTRFVTEGDLRRTVEKRYPGFPFDGFEVLSRGVSGRVGKLRLLGSDGRSLLVEGLAVRWTLDVPDTLFEARRQRGAHGDGWLFQGRGWGHGVGMCQAGAFGMAKRRLDYREILEHYYSGVELGLVRQMRPRPPVLGP